MKFSRRPSDNRFAPSAAHRRLHANAFFWLLFASLPVADCLANTAAATFGVNIQLSHSRNTGICVSEALSAETGASVYVVCDSGQFVEIAPTSGKPFAGVHGGAYRYYLNRSGASGYMAESVGEDMNAPTGTGTVTAMRIYRTGDKDSVLEMLVSF